MNESKIYHLRTPLKDEDMEQLKLGDIVYLSGTVFTARDEAHAKILEVIEKGEQLPMDFKGLALYHCGPVVREKDGGYEIVAAGPTTSMRMESVEAEFIEKTGIKMVIGKGGMGPQTAEAMRKYKAVYATFTGGAAVLAAAAVKRVINVYWLEELGIPEAVWVLEVDEFGPLVVTIDSTGKNYYEEKLTEAREKAQNEIIPSLLRENIP
ncbi:MAG: FumA C-terminus/TtdB family hydratase beta subunit [Desulfurococcales archaeon]|nr:FumA C-terminus/TtdB family hydratase beta subunit [Desulfurococcales archaeon]